MAELLVKSKIKEYVKNVEPEMRVNPDFIEALEAEVKALIEKAVKRAKDEGKKTLYPRHV
jgi:histone H3/H4